MNSTQAIDFGHYAESGRDYVITDPVTPRPWINYLGNRRLSAFISQNAGGLLWHKEPLTRRITRYHYTAAPGDRPGFYVYLRDNESGALWNPHFAPTCTPLDRFECRHSPGITRFETTRDKIVTCLDVTIPPDDDVMLWRLSLLNIGDTPRELTVASYMEFGLLEFLREAIGWCYLQHHFSLKFDPGINAIRYDYHVFEAPDCPRMLFGATETAQHWDCSRDAFIGRTGSLERPQALLDGHVPTDSELPLGGHACAVLGNTLRLEPRQPGTLGFIFALGPDWEAAEKALARYHTADGLDGGFRATEAHWTRRLSALQAQTGDAAVDHAVNTWNPYNALTALEFARIISTDHMGTDGLRYRDTTQDALAAATYDPAFAEERLTQVLEQQRPNGGGCFAFYPHTAKPTTDSPDRSDNTVWQIFTLDAIVAETGNLDTVDRIVPYRDGSRGSIYDHLLRGLKCIAEAKGPHGLPRLKHADWNDGLALFDDADAESVMLGMQLVHACRRMQDLALLKGTAEDAAWCADEADTLTTVLNSDLVWDGAWYRRLLLSDGTCLGSAASREGRIFLTPQAWAVISGIGTVEDRGLKAMESVFHALNTRHGIQILTPPYTGIPTPDDPPLGSNPGVGENGSIFCHANAWAIIAEALLGNGQRAFQYYRQILPEVLAAQAGPDHYGREPYVYASSIVGPASDRFGEGGISWLTGTASWMTVAITQYILGIRPRLNGLEIRPCLPPALTEVRVQRRFRGCSYDITLHREGRSEPALTVDGTAIEGRGVPVVNAPACRVEVSC